MKMLNRKLIMNVFNVKLHLVQIQAIALNVIYVLKNQIIIVYGLVNVLEKEI